MLEILNMCNASKQSAGFFLFISWNAALTVTLVIHRNNRYHFYQSEETQMNKNGI